MLLPRSLCPISPVPPPATPLCGPRTVQGDYAAGSCDNAHSAHVLFPQRVLHAGDDGANGRHLEGGARGAGERVPRVEGVVFVGHGGHNGLRCVEREAGDESEVESEKR